MKKLFAVLLALTMVVSFSACGRDKKNSSEIDGEVTASIISSDEYFDDIISEDEDNEEVSSDDGEEQEEVVSNEEKTEEDKEEKSEKEDKVVKKMFSSKKDLKTNGHYIYYSDGTWSYQSDSVSLVISDEDDIRDIKDRIEDGELFVITEDDLNKVAAG